MAPETASVPTNLTTNAFVRSGYTFTGWSTNTGGGGTTYADGASCLFNANVTLYAQWGGAASYTVTFIGNGSTSASMAPETASVPTNLTTNAFARSGYTFTGWSTNTGGGGTTYADGASYLFNANVTLYAQWAVAASYTVTFMGNGSTSGSMAPETASVPTNLT